MDKIYWVINFPWLVVFTFTIPDCSKTVGKPYYAITFVLSIVWIGLYRSPPNNHHSGPIPVLSASPILACPPNSLHLSQALCGPTFLVGAEMQYMQVWTHLHLD